MMIIIKQYYFIHLTNYQCLLYDESWTFAARIFEHFLLNPPFSPFRVINYLPCSFNHKIVRLSSRTKPNISSLQFPAALLLLAPFKVLEILQIADSKKTAPATASVINCSRKLTNDPSKRSKPANQRRGSIKLLWQDQINCFLTLQLTSGLSTS